MLVFHVCVYRLFIAGVSVIVPPDPKSKFLVMDMTEVAGRWEGTVRLMPGLEYQDDVFLTIKENGAYVFIGQGEDALFVGAGTFHLEDGHWSRIGKGDG